jgi:hypothetical protein
MSLVNNIMILLSGKILSQSFDNSVKRNSTIIPKIPKSPAMSITKKNLEGMN